MGIKKFTLEYVAKLKYYLDAIDGDAVGEIHRAIEDAAAAKAKVFVLGNGGSAATASHFVNDIGAGLRRRNLLNVDISSLADNTPVCTAISNDIGYENIFYMQLAGILKKEDLVIAISCSGNSPNIVKAVQYAREVGAKVVGLTGFDGGALKKLSHINFHVDAPAGEYGLVEDVHMILDHILHSYYISKSQKK